MRDDQKFCMNCRFHETEPENEKNGHSCGREKDCVYVSNYRRPMWEPIEMIAKTDEREDYKDCRAYDTITPHSCKMDDSMCLWCPRYIKPEEVNLGDYINGTEKEWNGETGDDQKTDFGKVDMSLMLDFRLAMEQVCKLSEFGAKKYSRSGWLEIEDLNRVTAAMLRHLYKEDIEDIDPDSGVAHDVAVAWNALARLELRLRKAE